MRWHGLRVGFANQNDESHIFLQSAIPRASQAEKAREGAPVLELLKRSFRFVKEIALRKFPGTTSGRYGKRDLTSGQGQ